MSMIFLQRKMILFGEEGTTMGYVEVNSQYYNESKSIKSANCDTNNC